MTKIISDYAQYYKKSLEDTELAQGNLALNELSAWKKISTTHLIQGRVNPSLLQQLFYNRSRQLSSINIFLRPIIFELSTSYKTKPGINLSRFISPITTIAQLKPNGRIYPIRSLIARDLFKPGQDNVHAIGTLKELDRYLKVCEQNSSMLSSRPLQNSNSINAQWQQYLNECHKALETLSHQWLKNSGPYVRADYAFICLESHLQSKYAPIKLIYDHLIAHPHTELPLFGTYIAPPESTKQPCLAAHANFTKRLACAQEKFSYTPSQRNALAHIAEQKDAEVLTINTPPNTGNKTLIKAAVINQWTLAASHSAEPPISIILSDHEDSLESISNSFGKNLLVTSSFFDGRWLPDLGEKLSQEATPEKKSFDPQYAELSDYVFSNFENLTYYEKAKESYLINAQLNFPQIKTNTVESIVEFLHGKIHRNVKSLTALESAWNSIKSVSQKIDDILGDTPEAVTHQAQEDLEKITREMDELITFAKTWEQFNNEHYKRSPLRALFSSHTEKQLLEAVAFVNRNTPLGITFSNCKSISSISKKITDLLEAKSAELLQIQEYTQGLQDLRNNKKIHSIDWAEAVIDLVASSGFSTISNLEEAESAADQTIRFDTFELATHYWEGRWLLEMEKFFKYPDAYLDIKNPLAILKKWRLRMMLVPCMGTSHYKLPLLFQTNFENRKDYLFNSIDLIIIDSAQQISPQEAAAAFTFARKALVLGDTLQADSNSSIGRYTDTANLQESKLAPSKHPEQEFLKLSSFGKTAALGSLMRIAQTSSRYHQILDLPPGLFLTEQLTSYNEIVQFSNKLCYHGVLNPVRGRKIEVAIQEKKILEDLPPLAYVHVDGYTHKSHLGGYTNETEAHAIAQWIYHRKKDLETYYKKPLSQILCVATPSPSQAQAIIMAFQSLNENTNNSRNHLTVVCASSALQNNAYPIVAFSNIYSKNIAPIHVTQDTKLFNAAITHTNDAFVFFADMDIIEKSLSATARGMLAQTLLSSDQNKINIPPQFRTDLEHIQAPQKSVERLKTLKDHHVFLKKTLLSEKTHHIHLACPALELSDLAPFTVNYLTAAIERGASVKIYTDMPNSGQNTFDSERPAQKSEELTNIIEMFKTINIPVYITSKLHTNLLICDYHTYCTGLYQWLNLEQPYTKEEPYFSIAYSGEHLTQEIAKQIKTLEDKIIHV